MVCEADTDPVVVAETLTVADSMYELDVSSSGGQSSSSEEVDEALYEEVVVDTTTLEVDVTMEELVALSVNVSLAVSELLEVAI